MGKARSFASDDDEYVYQTETDNENYSLSQQNSYNLGSTPFSDNSGIGNYSQRDQRNAALSGALFTGNIGFNLQTAVLDVPTKTIDLLEDATSAALPLVSVDRIITLSTGTSSELVTILGAQRPGQRFYLYNIITNTITVKNTAAATVNTILTPGTVDFVITGNALIEFAYDITTTKWRVVGNVGGSGGGSSIATLGILSTQLAGVVDFDSNIISGTGIIDEGNGIFKLSGNIFQLNSSILILGTDDTMEGKWQVSTNVAFTSPSDIGRNSLSITLNTTSSANLSNAPITSVFVDARASDLFVRLFTNDLIGAGTIQTLGTWGQIFSIGGGSGSGGGYGTIQDEGTALTQRSIMNFIGTGVTAVDNPGQSRTDITITAGGIALPINYDEQTLIPVAGEVTIDFSQPARHYTEITLTSDLIIHFTNFVTNKSELGTIDLIQNVAGGWKVTFDPVLLTTPVIDENALSLTQLLIKRSHGRLVGYTEGGITIGGVDVSQWATFQAVTDINFATFDGINIDRLLFDQGAGSPLAASSTGIKGDSGSNMLFNIPSSGNYNFKVNASGAASLIISETLLSSQTIIPLGTDTLGLLATPWNDVFTDTLTLKTDTTIAGNIAGDMIHNIPSSGNYRFGINGNLNTFIIAETVISSQTIFPIGTDDLGLVATPWNTVFATTINTDNVIAGGAGNGMTNIGHLDFVDNLATPIAALSIYSDGTDLFANTGGGVVNFSQIGISNKIEQGDSNVTVIDTGTGQINFVVDASTVGSFNSVAFSPTIPIDMTVGKDIIGLSKIRYISNTDVIANTEASIALRSDIFLFNVAGSGDRFELKFNGTSQHFFTNTSLTSPNLITNNTLIINDSSLDPAANGIFSRNGNVLGIEIPEFAVRRTTPTGINSVELNLVKVDAGPGSGDNIGDLNFQIDDSGTITTYAQVRSEIREATNAGRLYLSVRANNSATLQDAIEIIGNDNVSQTFININARISSNLEFGPETGGVDFKIFPAVNTIGITFDNVAYTNGSAGTFAPPFVTSLGATKEAADTAFGNHRSSMGILDTGTGALTLFLRQNDGNYAAVTLARDVLV